jgi:hypothetical protein
MYDSTHEVRFTKLFNDGLLKGLKHSDSIRFVCYGAAENWINTIRYKSEKGQLNYCLIDHGIFEIKTSDESAKI